MNNIRQSGAVALAAFWLILALGVGISALAQTPEVRPLIMGKAIERELKGDEAHSYSLALTAGQYLHVVVKQKGIDVVVTLFDADGKEVIEVDSPNGIQGPEPIALIIETAGNYRLEVRSLEKTAAAGRYEVKIKELRTATEKDKKRIAANKIFDEAEALYNQGTAESLRNAIKKYEESLPVFSAIEDHQREAKTLNNIGIVYSDLGENQQALKFYNESLPLSRAIGDKSGEAYTLHNIGAVYSDLGENQQALKFYNESLLLNHVVGDKRGEAYTLHNIGAVYSDLGEKQQALKFYNESLPLSRAIGDKDGEAYTLHNIGGIYSYLGENQQALKYYNESLVIFRAIGDKRSEANTLQNIGTVYSDLGRKQQALKFYNESLPLSRGVGDKGGEASTLQNIGAVYADLGKNQQALKFYNESLPLSRAVGEKRSEANTLSKLFESLALGNPRFGVFYGKLSLNNYQELRSNVKDLDKNVQQTFLKSIEDVYRGLADALIKQQRYAEAQQILNAFKDQQFFDFNQNKQFASLAFTSREAQLAKTLDQKLENIVIAIRAQDEFESSIGSRQQTADETAHSKSLAGKQAAANADYLAFLSFAEKEFAAPLDEKDKTPDVTDLREMQTALKDLSTQTKQKIVAVYMLVGESEYKALLITPDSIDSVSYPIKGVELNQKALQLWKLLRTPDYDPQPIAAELYKIVFAPLAAKLPKDTKTILWSMDGNLRYVPMAALHDGKGYLVERFNNVIFTRADKERLTRTVSRNWTGTGLGSSKEQNVKLFDTTYKFEQLFAVETELNRIFKKTNSNGIFAGDFLLDAEFTRPAMLAALKNHRPLVHIASHFKFEAGDEARSFLLLGDGSPFTLDEMKTEKDLFGGVELLTLSACQTAAQRPDATGREVDGFAELAQRLGAGAIMASLWELSDDSTAELMTRFYQTYNDGKTNKAEALRTAQIALLKGDYKENPTTSLRKPVSEEDAAANIKIEKTKLRQYTSPKNAPFAHPFYWSPFVLFGNWK